MDSRYERRRQLAREIETHWRRRTARQVLYVVAGASLLSAFFILGRAFMPMIPADPDAEEKTEQPAQQAQGGDGGAQVGFIIAAAALAVVGAGCYAGAKMLTPKEESQPPKDA